MFPKTAESAHHSPQSYSYNLYICSRFGEQRERLRLPGQVQILPPALG